MTYSIIRHSVAGVLFTGIILAYACVAIVTLIDFDKLSFVLSSLAVCLLVAIIFISLVFVLARKLKRYDIIDIAWGPTFIIVSVTSYIIAYDNISLSSLCLLVLGMVFVWGSRLAWHIGKRKIGSKNEDPRYVELRKNWKGREAVNMYFRVYIVQAILATIICIPVIHINLFDGSQWTVLAYIGIAVWLSGIICESIADKQLKEHLSSQKNRGKIMQSGLWQYSRHPNYFGEIVQWWGIGIIAAGVAPWWVGLVGPLTITYLILFVSGIPPTEKRFEGRFGWRSYREKTSALVPWPPKY